MSKRSFSERRAWVIARRCLSPFWRSSPGSRRRRAHALRSAQVFDVVPGPAGPPAVYFVFARAEFFDAPSELYVLPLAWVAGDSSAAPGSVLARVQAAAEPDEARHGALVDALDDPRCSRAILEALVRRQRARGDASELVSSTEGDIALAEADLAEPRKLSPERERTTIRFGDRFVLRVSRRVEEGVSPELELGRFLAERTTELTPRLWGAIELHQPSTEPLTVAVLQSFVPNEGTAWQHTLQELGRYYDRVLAQGPRETCPPAPLESPWLLVAQEPPQLVSQMIGSYGVSAERLGERVAELHLALTATPGDPAFAPEPYSALDRRSKYQSLRNLIGKALRVLRERLRSLPRRAQEEAYSLLERESSITKSFEPLLRAKMTALRIRTHGYLHLESPCILYTGKDFVITDFDGFRQLTLAERRPASDRHSATWPGWSVPSSPLRVQDPARRRDRTRRTTSMRGDPGPRIGTAWVSRNDFFGATSGRRRERGSSPSTVRRSLSCSTHSDSNAPSTN